MDFTGFQKIPNTGKPIFSLDMKQFSPLLTLHSRLKIIEELNLKIIGYKKIFGMLNSLILGNELHFVANKLPTEVYRGVKYKPEITNKSEIWYKPNTENIDRGRCNEPKKQIFYGATSLESVLFELDTDKDEVVTICRCNLVKESDLILLLLGLSPETLNNIETPKVLEDDINRFFDIYKSNLNINNIPISKLSEDFIFQIFFHKYMSLKNTNTDFYKITNAICKILFSDSGIGGILYPNINTFFNKKYLMSGWNIAMKPEVIDKYYNLSEMWRLKYMGKNNNKENIGFFEYSNEIEKNGSIVWSDFVISNLPDNFNGRVIR